LKVVNLFTGISEQRERTIAIPAVARIGWRPCRPVLLLSLLLLAGCDPEDISDRYGGREGADIDSVNGTSVLGEMITKAGHRVSSARELSPQLGRRANCIVWFPDDFNPPTRAVRSWLEDWLWDEPGRTLVYVGRDFDAATWYWAKVQPSAPAAQAAEVAARLSRARSRFLAERGELPEQRDCDWFTVDGRSRPRRVGKLQGDPQWLAEIDPAKVEIELRGGIEPSAEAQVLLKSDDDVLVSREEIGDSQLLIVANGSFLLNLPLVNREHRKLAGKLIAQVGPPGRAVVFLESDAGGPPIRHEDPGVRMPSGLEILLISPLDWIFVHLAVVGVLFCFCRWPIFGLPRELPREATSDFGKHIAALAELLERSRDRTYAEGRLTHYRALSTAARE
jgi:hypothetical protein